jgi:VWFA-related protein
MGRFFPSFPIAIVLALSIASAQNAPPPRSVEPRPAALAEASSPPAPATDRQISLEVQVTDKYGAPIRGLEERDFTVLDDKQPQKIVSFRAVDAGAPASADPSVEVVLVVDAVNTGFRSVAYERDEVRKFLLQNGGKLAWPVSFIVVSEAGTKVQSGSSRDGNALAALYEQYENGLRSANLTNGGRWGAEERIDMSLKALASIIAYEKTRPGRKLMIWFSRGWPMLSERIHLTSKQAQEVFTSIVDASTRLRQAHITLYSVDPVGLANGNVMRNSYYEQFVKGVTSPSRALPGNLGLQVLAVQTGGRVFNSSNDITQAIADCVADAASFYILSFNSLPADQPDEYHALQVRIDKPGITARTRTGYYDQR